MIIYISRKNLKGRYSIYKIFSKLSKNIDKSLYLEVPFKSSFFGIIGNLFYIFLLRLRYKSVTIYHVTGDIHYAPLVLPRNKTVLTIHDLYGIRNHYGLKKLYFNFLWVYLPLIFAENIFVPSYLIKRQLKYIQRKNRINRRVKINVVSNPILYE